MTQWLNVVCLAAKLPVLPILFFDNYRQFLVEVTFVTGWYYRQVWKKIILPFLPVRQFLGSFSAGFLRVMIGSY